MNDHPWDGPAIVRTPSIVERDDLPACFFCEKPAQVRAADTPMCRHCYDDVAAVARANADTFDMAIGDDPAPLITTLYRHPVRTP